MTYLELLSEMLKDQNFAINVNTNRNHITFNYHKAPLANNYYQLIIKDHDANISKIRLKSRNKNGRSFFIPDTTSLLSVDLRNPHSIKTIQEWLETLR